MMISAELGETIPAPSQTEDDAFNSNTVAGFITYRLPSPSELLGTPDHVLHQYLSMTFELYLQVNDDVLGTYDLKCDDANKWRCQVTYKRAYTPVIFDLSPPVVYFGSETTIIFDPKSTTGLIQDLASDELAFINVKIGGALLDFEATVTHENEFRQWYRSNIVGRVGDQKPSASHSVEMNWETGASQQQPIESVHCEVDGTTCYTAKTVPVIFDVSSHTGYTTGGQQLTVTGYGFNSENIVAEVDGVACTVTSFSDEEFTCDV